MAYDQSTKKLIRQRLRPRASAIERSYFRDWLTGGSLVSNLKSENRRKCQKTGGDIRIAPLFVCLCGLADCNVFTVLAARHSPSAFPSRIARSVRRLFAEEKIHLYSRCDRCGTRVVFVCKDRTVGVSSIQLLDHLQCAGRPTEGLACCAANSVCGDHDGSSCCLLSPFVATFVVNFWKGDSRSNAVSVRNSFGGSCGLVSLLGFAISNSSNRRWP